MDFTLHPWQLDFVILDALRLLPFESKPNTKKLIDRELWDLADECGLIQPC